MTVLVVDDEQGILDVVSYALRKEGFRVVPQKSGLKAVDAVLAGGVDAVILDVGGLAGIDGFEACRRIRASSAVPILMLTSRKEEVDRIVGLEIGADDYITKPFSPRELVARVRAVMRRTVPAVHEEATPVLRHGPIVLDRVKFKVAHRGREIALSKIEFAILELMMKSPGRVFSRQDLLDQAWDDPDVVTDRTIDTHIKSIRKKFKAVDKRFNLIATIRGLGYRMEEDA